MNLKSLIAECRKRKMFKGLSIYAIVSWLIIQVAATTFPYLGIPRSAVTFIIIMVLIGLPVSLIFSWHYNIIIDEETDQFASSQENTLDESSSMIFRYIIIFISVLIMGVILILAKNLFQSGKVGNDNVYSSDKIAVLTFKNNTGIQEFEVLGQAISDWLAHGIVENDLGKVISNDIISDYSEVMEASITGKRVLEDLLTPQKIISGGIFEDGDQLIFKSSIQEGLTGQTVYAFPEVKGNKENPTKLIEELQAEVLGYLALEKNPELNLESTPPMYKAYKELAIAKILSIDDPKVITHIDKALNIDSNYFEAKLYKLSHFYSLGQFAKADSLLSKIKPIDENDFRQLNLLNFYKSLLSGKNKLVYESWKNEYNYAPFSLPDNSTMMTIALQYVNRPREIESIFSEIDMQGMKIQTCEFCNYRLYTMAMADLELENYRRIMSLLQPQIRPNVNEILLNPLTSAFIRSGNHSLLNDLFDELPQIMVSDEWKELYLHVGKEYLLINETQASERYLQMALSYYKGKNVITSEANVHMLLNNFEKAIELYESEVVISEASSLIKAMMAICYYKTGQVEKSEETISSLNQKGGKYEFGESDYYIAYFNAYIGRKEIALEHLKKAVSSGFIFSGNRFHNDVPFKNLRYLPEYQDILKYWH